MAQLTAEWGVVVVSAYSRYLLLPLGPWQAVYGRRGVNNETHVRQRNQWALHL